MGKDRVSYFYHPTTVRHLILFYFCSRKEKKKSVLNTTKLGDLNFEHYFDLGVLSIKYPIN